jgi:urea transport system substrate-binding protein
MFKRVAPYKWLSIALICLALALGACSGPEAAAPEPAVEEAVEEPAVVEATEEVVEEEVATEEAVEEEVVEEMATEEAVEEEVVEEAVEEVVEETSAEAPEEVMAEASGEPIKVGILHSLSGTMAISEVSVKDSTQLAIDQINAAGGVLGRPLEAIVEDGASDWPTFAEKARKLIQEDEVVVVFGGWTSASRKAMLPVFEELNGLLFYPVQYEGLEASPNIFYTGAEPTQQIIPGVEYLLEEGSVNMYLIGSDYVFPRTANKIIKAQLEAAGVSLAGEQYIPLGDTDFQTIIAEISSVQPDAIFNTLNGDSNVAFFKQFQDAGFTADEIPIMSVSVAEEEVRGIGPEFLAGHLVSWNYYQTTDTPENEAFVAAYKEAFGEERVTADPIEAGYISVNVWAKLVEAAGSTDVAAIKAAADENEITFDAPEGLVTVDGVTQHIYKTPRIGLIGDDGQITEVWATAGPIKPDPFLLGVDWAAGLIDESEIPADVLAGFSE